MSEPIKLKTFTVAGSNPVSFSFHPTWYAWFMEEGVLDCDEFTALIHKLLEEESKKDLTEREILLPTIDLWFAAFQDDPELIYAVLIGQDLYTKRKYNKRTGSWKNMATGYSFDISPDFKSTGSMRNIYVGIERQYKDQAININKSYAVLKPWVKQGVFLLNAALTIGAKKLRPMKKDPNETRNLPKYFLNDWNFFLEDVIRILCRKRPFLVFILWGNFAADLESTVAIANRKYETKHKCLKSYHPSRFGEIEGKKANAEADALKLPRKMNVFSEENHFLEVNQLLSRHYQSVFKPIEWYDLPTPAKVIPTNYSLDLATASILATK